MPVAIAARTLASMCLESCLGRNKTWEGERRDFSVGSGWEAESRSRKRRGKERHGCCPWGAGRGPPEDKEETERGRALGRKIGPTSVLQSKKERNG